MAGNLKYTEREILNKALNAGEDALKVDIDNVTLNTEGSDVSLEVDLDNATDDVLVYGNDGATNRKIKTDADGNVQVDIVTSALPSGGATAANQTTIIGHVDGLEGLITSSNTKLDTLETTLTAIETDAAAIELATEATQSAVEKTLYGTALEVDIGSGDDDLGGGTEIYEALYIGTGGNVVLDMGVSGTSITFNNLASGQLLPVRVNTVKQTGTTATGIVALRS